jgi:hypothetical protein
MVIVVIFLHIPRQHGRAKSGSEARPARMVAIVSPVQGHHATQDEESHSQLLRCRKAGCALWRRRRSCPATLGVRLRLYLHLHLLLRLLLLLLLLLLRGLGVQTGLLAVA